MKLTKDELINAIEKWRLDKIWQQGLEHAANKDVFYPGASAELADFISKLEKEKSEKEWQEEHKRLYENRFIPTSL